VKTCRIFFISLLSLAGGAAFAAGPVGKAFGNELSKLLAGDPTPEQLFAALEKVSHESNDKGPQRLDESTRLMSTIVFPPPIRILYLYKLDASLATIEKVDFLASSSYS
jgi:hypothetical protein